MNFISPGYVAIKWKGHLLDTYGTVRYGTVRYVCISYELILSFYVVGKRKRGSHPRYWLTGFIATYSTIKEDDVTLNLYYVRAEDRLMVRWTNVSQAVQLQLLQ